MCQGKGCTSSNPRIRYTPTFFHHPIFGEYERDCFQNTRCNSNTRSNTFNRNVHKQPRNCQSRLEANLQQGRGRQCCKDKQVRREERVNEYNDNQDSLQQIKTQPKIRPSSAQKQVRLQKQISFNPHASNQFHNAGSHSALSNHTKLWYNPQKQILLRQCSNCHHHGLPRQRKLLQMSSCPFYTQDGNAHLIQASRCRQCSKLVSCPLCGGDLSCRRCKYQSGYPNGCKCQDSKYESEVCTCGPCRKCGCGQNFKQQVRRNQVEEEIPKSYTITATRKLNACNKCQDSCPCSHQCYCNDNCVCCAKKQYNQQYNKKQTNCKCNSKCVCGPNCACGPNCSCCKNYQSAGCGCSKGCKCGYDCTCGTNCRCCPKFLPYDQCICEERCICGPSCKCSSGCGCCPKNKITICPKQSYKNYQSEARFCKCGPQCGCGPECRCGPQCRCGQMKSKPANIVREQQVGKGTKTTVGNGMKKTKIQQNNIRKSQPVFKSVTGRRG